MQYIEAPSGKKPKFKSVFLAGGITDCPDWQAYVVKNLKNQSISVFNPRRKNFPINNPNAAKEQIEWEYQRLREANIISFWFSRGSLNPIVLFELGAALEREVNIVVGIDPEYSRKTDVEMQTSLRRPEIKIVYSLDELVINIVTKSGECPAFNF